MQGDSTSSLDLVFGLPLEQLHERMRRAVRKQSDGKRELAHFLVDMDERKLYRETAHVDTVHFAEAWLDEPPRRTRELLQFGRAHNRLKIVASAYEELGWSRTVEVLRVVQDYNQEEWVEFARTHSVRKLRATVKACGAGDSPEDAGYGLIHVKSPFRTEFTAGERARIEELRQRLAGGGPLDDHDLLLRMAAVCFEHLPPQAEPVPPTCPVVEPNTTELPAPVRRLVLDRDDHACQSCGRRWGLHVHHIVPREHGGSHEFHNLLTLCDTCHTLVHDGKLRITGDAERGFTCETATGLPVEPACGGGRPPRRRASRMHPVSPPADLPASPVASASVASRLL